MGGLFRSSNFSKIISQDISAESTRLGSEELWDFDYTSLYGMINVFMETY